MDTHPNESQVSNLQKVCGWNDFAISETQLIVNCWFGGFGGLDFLDPRKWKGLLLHGNLRIPNQGTFHCVLWFWSKWCHIGYFGPGNDPKNQHQNPRNLTMISKPNKSLTTRPQMAKSNPSETMTLIHMAIMSCILSFTWDVRNWHHICYNCKEMFWILTCALFAGISYSSQSNARIYTVNTKYTSIIGIPPNKSHK